MSGALPVKRPGNTGGNGGDGGGCTPGTEVYVTATAQPTVAVLGANTVQLRGAGEVVTTRKDCTTVTHPTTGGTWSLGFQDPSGNSTDATDLLAATSGAASSFVPAAVGTYTAWFRTGINPNFGSGSVAISVTANASNVGISGIETTQCIQYFNFNHLGSGYAADNSIPLVAGKPTILRVYVDAQQRDTALPVPATLDGFVWAYNTITGTSAIYHSINGPITARPASEINRNQPGNTVDFNLDLNMSQGQVLCEVVIYDPANWQTNIDRSFPTLNFVAVPALSLHSVLIHYTGVDYYDNPVDAQTTGWDVAFVADYLLRVYPVSDISFDGCETLEWNAKLAVTANFNALSAKVAAMRAMSGSNDVYAGFIPPAAGCAAVCGLGGGGSAIFFSHQSFDEPGAAHEIGHALGRAHAPCGNPPEPDPNYPRYNGFPSGSIGECGVDPRGYTLHDPSSTTDYMSYCGPVWTSPYGYTQILEALQSGRFTARQLVGAQHVSEYPGDGEYHYFAFHIDTTAGLDETAVTIDNSFHLSRIRPLTPTPSDVTVVLLDDQRQLLYASDCEVTPHSDNSPISHYHTYFPHYPELKTVRILRGQATVAEYPVADAPPTIADIGIDHHDDRIELRWAAQAAENTSPAIEYGIRYSADGRRWKALVAGAAHPAHTIDTTLLPGGDNCCLQIVASAGFRTAIYESEPFSRPTRPRTAWLLTPRPDTEYIVGEPITFAGTAFSPDYGNATSDEIVWTSPTLGTIGVGQTITRADLPAGHHWISMHATDGTGAQVTKTLAIRIKPRQIPAAASITPPPRHPCGCAKPTAAPTV